MTPEQIKSLTREEIISQIEALIDGEVDYVSDNSRGYIDIYFSVKGKDTFFKHLLGTKIIKDLHWNTKEPLPYFLN